MEEDKLCQNCKYYRAIYKIIKSRLLKIGDCCQKTKIQKNFVISDISRNTCPRWESDAPLKEEKRQNIIKTLHEMQKRLKVIEMILKAEE